MMPNLTDRAFRYRASRRPPEGEKRCAFCGVKNGTVEVGHLDGHEENGEPENLIWTCRSCNVTVANVMRSANLGRLTHQYNPSGGAKSAGQWITAVTAMKGQSDAMTVADAVAMIRATPAAARSRYSAELWKKRKQIYGRSGRATEAEDRWNPMKKKPNVQMGYQDASGFHPIRKSSDYDPSRGKDPAASFAAVGRKLARRRGNPGKPGSAFERCVRSVEARGSAYDPKAVCASAGRKKYGAAEFQRMAVAGRRRAARHNPADGAQASYEAFHGHPAHELVIVQSRFHYHTNLWAMGDLEYLIVAGVDGYEHTIDGFGKGCYLCSNEAPEEKRSRGILGNQMFIEGGDQNLDLSVFGFEPGDEHEIETLGQIVEVGYFTEKDHLGDEGGKAIYFHKLGEEGTVRKYRGGVTYDGGWPPDLIYRLRDPALEISGGSYTISPEGIVN